MLLVQQLGLYITQVLFMISHSKKIQINNYNNSILPHFEVGLLK